MNQLIAECRDYVKFYQEGGETTSRSQHSEPASMLHETVLIAYHIRARLRKVKSKLDQFPVIESRGTVWNVRRIALRAPS